MGHSYLSSANGPLGKPLRIAVVLVLSALTLPVAVQAQPAGVQDVVLPKPAARDRRVALLIAQLMPRHHISAQKLNDTISRRALERFISSLDPMKLYFYQSDIDEFDVNATMIDDMVRKGDLSLAYEIFARFIERVDERVTVALELLDGELDFTIDESMIIDPDAAQYASNESEARDRWRRQIKYAVLDLKDEGKEGREAIEQLQRRYKRYARRWKQTDNDDLLEMYLTAITSGYDPHSTYMSAGTLNDFEIQMSLNLEGIGAQLREKDGNTVVTRVIPGGAAEKHGKLKTDDVIVSVGQGDEGEMTDIVEMPLTDVVDLIRGKARTVVRLGVKAGGVGNVEVYKIIRESIELQESAARGEVIEHASANGETIKIGYINLPSFYLDMEAARRGLRDFRSSTRDVHKILDDFRVQGVDGVVLDLSKNGGGSLTEAINLTGLFIDQGYVVQVKDSNGAVESYRDETPGTAWSGPLVVLTSKFSASASEIFAGAIQDYRRGIVVGDPATHGKGTVQTLMDLDQRLMGRTNNRNLGALKVTLQQFFLPDGQSTQRTGVAADIVIPSIIAKMDIGEADLKYALDHDTVTPVRHDLYSMTPADLLGKVRQQSLARVADNEEFVDLLRRVDLYVTQKEQDSVSLLEDEFMARRKELDAQKEEEEEQLDQQIGSEVIFRDNFYNQEVMNIAHDYIEGLREQNLAQVD